MQENWERVKNIFSEAVDLPHEEREQFVADQCRGDSILNDEVLSLLRSDQNSDKGEFSHTNLAGLLKDSRNGRFSEDSDFAIGDYKIVKQIGIGGMGEVFLAEDSKLERQVALKLMSTETSQNPESIARFIREAKLASSLNHPNIVTIYEIGEFDHSHFIASEYIDGMTLSKRMKKEPYSVPEALELAIQVGAALEAAHNIGVIHRDIKPDNIMIRKDGIVKVLDFGLAKLLNPEVIDETVQSEAETRAHLKTREGMIMGTAAYMSPEQTRGKEVDKRSDIWSFGVVLYELIAGRRPFRGETPSDLIAAILKTEAPRIDSTSEPIPQKLESIIEKTLRKNKNERYQNVADLLVDLKSLAREIEHGDSFESLPTNITQQFDDEAATGGGFVGAQSTAEGRYVSGTHSNISALGTALSRPTTSLFAILGGLILIGAIYALYLYAPSFFAESKAEMQFIKITSAGNVMESYATISPDGKYVAYVSRETEGESLQLRQTATKSNIELLKPQSKKTFWGLTFSPDGNHIYYTQGVPGDFSLYKIPALGGESEKLLDDLYGTVTFSPDAKQIAFVRNDREIIVANSDGSNPNLLAKGKKSEGWMWLAWSPNGEVIVGGVHLITTGKDALRQVNMSTKEISDVSSRRWDYIGGIKWIDDGSELLISGKTKDSLTSQIWRLAYPSGKLARVTNDLSIYSGISLTGDKKSLVTVKEDVTSTIWLKTDNSGEMTQLSRSLDTDDGIRGLAAGDDGRVVFSSKSGGKWDLWITGGDLKEPTRLTRGGGMEHNAEIAPDGSFVVFASKTDSSTDIWRIDIDGTNQKRLTNNSGGENDPTITRDGKWVFFTKFPLGGKTSIWKVPSDGGEATQVIKENAAYQTMSPDGRHFACLLMAPPRRIAVFTLEGEVPVDAFSIPERLSRGVKWSADGKSLMYIDRSKPNPNIWAQPINGDGVTKITNFDSDNVFRFAFSPDGKYMALSRGNSTSDVILIDNY